MKSLWCWRCQEAVLMLDENEFAEMEVLYGLCLAKLKEHLMNAGLSISQVGQEQEADFFRPVREWYLDRTGEITTHNDIRHHRLFLYGPPCSACGKPLRTSKAAYCATCGQSRS